MNVPVPLSVPVPPVPATVTVVVPPWQVMVPALADAVTGVGWAIVTEVVAVHPLASVTT